MSFDFAAPINSRVSPIRKEMVMESQTDRINRLLVLWLELQQAIRQASPSQRLPWHSTDERVVHLWSQITHPSNQRALEEWLFQVASGQSEIWAQHALLECRRRASLSTGVT
jgi:hypothetical protein